MLSFPESYDIIIDNNLCYIKQTIFFLSCSYYQPSIQSHSLWPPSHQPLPPSSPLPTAVTCQIYWLDQRHKAKVMGEESLHKALHTWGQSLFDNLTVMTLSPTVTLPNFYCLAFAKSCPVVWSHIEIVY